MRACKSLLFEKIPLKCAHEGIREFGGVIPITFCALYWQCLVSCWRVLFAETSFRLDEPLSPAMRKTTPIPLQHLLDRSSIERT